MHIAHMCTCSGGSGTNNGGGTAGSVVHEFQLAAKTFYTSAWNYRRLSADALAHVSAADEPTPFKPVAVPEDAELGTFADAFLLSLRTDWTPPGASHR